MTESARDVLIRWADDTAEDRLAFDVVADQILAALAEAGYAVVPVEPTEEMLKAAIAACWSVQEAREDRFVDVEKVMEWLRPVCRAMLAAAQKPGA